LGKYCSFECVKIFLRKFATLQSANWTVDTSFNLHVFVLRYVYTETVAGLRVAVLLAEENKTKWAPTIGYVVVLELHVALSLAAEHGTKWVFPLRFVRTAWRTANLVGGNGSATLNTQSGIRMCEVEKPPSLIGWPREMRHGFGII
jgi:hypothetical protein